MLLLQLKHFKRESSTPWDTPSWVNWPRGLRETQRESSIQGLELCCKNAQQQRVPHTRDYIMGWNLFWRVFFIFLGCAAIQAASTYCIFFWLVVVSHLVLWLESSLTSSRHPVVRQSLGSLHADFLVLLCSKIVTRTQKKDS